ncbi:MAG: hypothetical protein ACRC3B_02055, partial [Bacteroidia bacterium]
MKKILYTASIIASATLVSCGDYADPRKKDRSSDGTNYPESPYEKEQRLKDSLAKLPPAAVTFEQAIADTLELKHNVIIEGYFQLPQLSSSSDRGQSMNFYGRRNQMHG